MNELENTQQIISDLENNLNWQNYVRDIICHGPDCFYLWHYSEESRDNYGEWSNDFCVIRIAAKPNVPGSS